MSRHLALFMHSLSIGGVPRRVASLAGGLAAAGCRVDLLVLEIEDAELARVDPRVRVIRLGDWRAMLPWVRRKRRRQFPLVERALARYLRRERPDVLISADNQANLVAVAAHRRAGRLQPLVLTQRNHTSTYMADKPKLLASVLAAYPAADAVVGVSAGVTRNLAELGLDPARLLTIYNAVPIDSSEIAEPVDHPFFAAGAPPVIVGVGRLTPQKDFPTLLRAFARLIADGHDLRLMLVGGGKKDQALHELQTVAGAAGIADRVALVGAVRNALPYMAAASVFVLSSRWEGLPGVVIEALACGTRVVSTDCPSGPREILEDGRYGRLVPVGDDAAMASAILEELATPRSPDELRARAASFSMEAAVAAYLALVERLCEPQ
jgi:glycosyltransferase involved in cell wall biosynthesis